MAWVRWLPSGSALMRLEQRVYKACHMCQQASSVPGGDSGPENSMSEKAYDDLLDGEEEIE
jgi:hypothetical protein